MLELFDSALSHLILTNQVSEAMQLFKSKVTPSNTLTEEHIAEYFQWMNQLVFSQVQPTDQTLDNVMLFTAQLSERYSPAPNPLETLLRRIKFLSRTPDQKMYNKKVMIFFIKAHQHNLACLNALVEKAPPALFNELWQTMSNDNLIRLDPTLLAWMNQLRINSLDSYDLELCKVLEQIIGEEHLTPLPEESMKKLQFLQKCPQDIVEKLHQIMHPLITGQPSLQTNSSISYLLAAIREDKEEQYEFTPTLVVVNSATEDFSPLEQYLQSIASVTPPVKEHFILANHDRHWMSGEVRLDEEGHVKIFLSDSAFDADVQLDFLSKCALKALFPGKKVELYLTNEQRQNEQGVCKFYAVNDVRKLYTIEQYGPKEDLFYQLDRRIMDNRRLDDGTIVKMCKPPLSLMRSMQSRTVFKAIEPEQDRIINKRNQTLHSSTLEHFSHTESGQLLQNTQIRTKQKKMIDRLDNWIMRHLATEPRAGYDYICNSAKAHELPAFQAKSHRETSSKGLRPSFGT